MHTDLLVSAWVIFWKNLSDEFTWYTGVKQGCLFPFSMYSALSWAFEKHKKEANLNQLGYKMPIWDKFEDLLVYFADDLALLSQWNRGMQLKTNQLAKPTERIAKFDKPITLYSTNIEDVTEFAYFGSKFT